MKPSSAMDLYCAGLSASADEAAGAVVTGGGAAVVWSGALSQADNSASESEAASISLAAVWKVFIRVLSSLMVCMARSITPGPYADSNTAAAWFEVFGERKARFWQSVPC